MGPCLPGGDPNRSGGGAIGRAACPTRAPPGPQRQRCAVGIHYRRQLDTAANPRPRGNCGVAEIGVRGNGRANLHFRHHRLCQRGAPQPPQPGFQLNAILALSVLADIDRILLPLPLHHVYPFVIGILLPLAKGLPIVMPQALTGPQMLRAIREGWGTVVPGVPRLVEVLCSGIEARVSPQDHLPRCSS
jgi:hypothetical protein